MSANKGKPRYNRAIALAKMEKAHRLLADVKKRLLEDDVRWSFAFKGLSSLVLTTTNLLEDVVTLEKAAQRMTGDADR